jgi:hypothetical protein
MALTVYNDVILTTAQLSGIGVRGKNMRKNERVMNQGGFQQATVIYSQSLRQYELGTVPMLPEVWATIEGLHEVTDGGAIGFLMQDPKDNLATITNGVLVPIQTGVTAGTSGFGYGVPTYQMHKRLTSIGSTRAFDRKVTRPKSPSTIERGGVPVSPSINYDTGLITFTADTSEAMTSITVGATTILNFASGAGIVAALAPGDRVYITGVTGTAATTLNNLSHAITAEGATSLTISTNTSGLTASAGTAFKYPQPNESLMWSGSFYVPVHFMNDELDWDLIRPGPYDTRLLAGPSVILEEVRE